MYLFLSTYFLAELFCSLTRNILGLKSCGGRRADDVQMTCRRHADDTRARLHWRFQLADDICHLDIICMSSEGGYVICMSSAHAHVIRT